MKITVNDKNEVIGYVNIGGLRNSLDIDNINLPINFKEEFEPRKFIYADGEVKYNAEFGVKDDEVPSRTPSVVLNDEGLRKMVANIQKQVVQSTKLSIQTSQQNAMMAKQIVKLEKELTEKKGEVENA